MITCLYWRQGSEEAFPRSSDAICTERMKDPAPGRRSHGSYSAGLFVLVVITGVIMKYPRPLDPRSHTSIPVLAHVSRPHVKDADLNRHRVPDRVELLGVV